MALAAEISFQVTGSYMAPQPVSDAVWGAAREALATPESSTASADFDLEACTARPRPPLTGRDVAAAFVRHLPDSLHMLGDPAESRFANHELGHTS